MHHRPVAFEVCAAVFYSWEEEQLASPSCAPSDYSNAERLQQHHHHHHHTDSRGQGLLSSVLAVFDTLTDACFATFNDGDTETLAAALGAVWAADGALRRVSMQKTPWEDGDGGDLSPDSDSYVTSSAPTTKTDSVPAEGGGACGDSSAGLSGLGQQSSNGLLNSSGGGGGHVDEDTSGQENGNDAMIGKWVEDSRVVGVVRSLTQRCRGLPARVAEKTGKNGYGDGDSGDQLASSTEGVEASLPSEDTRDNGAAWPQMGALSLLELAEAVLDAVGPEATGDILAVCPQLLENMPPKVCTK